MKKIIVFIFTLCISFFQLSSQNEFITRWDLSKSGSGTNNQISFSTYNLAGSISYTWQEISPGSSSGSGSFAAATFAFQTISSLPANAIIELRINPANLQRFQINNGLDRERLIDVTQWGTTVWTSMASMFRGCSNLNISATDIPDLTSVTTMASAFQGCTILNGPTNINSWNTGNINSMPNAFRDAAAFNQPIGNWNTGRVTNTQYMFYGASSFNQAIGTWNVANVTLVNYMFYGASAFNNGGSANINNWNTGSFLSASYMFSGALNFNQPIGNWNTGSVRNINNMFQGAIAFNQDISSWNLSNVININNMFDGATAFNQNLGNWGLGNVAGLGNVLSNCGMSCENYSYTLTGWAAGGLLWNISLGADGLTYGNNISNVYNWITAPTSSGGLGWVITDAGNSGGTCGPSVFFSKSTGNLDDLATWGSNSDGTGTQPTNFTSAAQIFLVRNRTTASFSGNWAVSGANSMVIWGDGGTHCTFSTGSNLLTGSFRLVPYSTLEIGSASSISLFCDIFSTVVYNSSANQAVDGGDYWNLTIAGSNTKTLSADSRVLGDLTLSNNLSIGAQNFEITGLVSGASSTAYIQTGGTGTVTRKIQSTSGFVFPVGNSSYNPVQITNKTSSADIFQVRVDDAVYKNGLSGTTATEPRINRTWQISKNIPTANAGSGVDFVFNYNAGEEVGTLVGVALYHHNGTQWLKPSTGSGVPGTYQLAYTGYKGSFSPFALGDDITPLPLHWLNFNCTNKGGQTELNWVTANEDQTKVFEVERSYNGTDFKVVGYVNAAGSSFTPRHYGFTDFKTSYLPAYYRIKLVNLDNTTETSSLCYNLNQVGTNNFGNIRPNPVFDLLAVDLPTETETTCKYEVYNSCGALLISGNHTSNTNSKTIYINTHSLPSGTYVLKLDSPGLGKTETKLFVKGN